MIDSAIIDEIKYRNDLVDVISSYVSLKRAGSTETPDAVLCTVVGNQLYYATMSELCRAQIR